MTVREHRQQKWMERQDVRRAAGALGRWAAGEMEPDVCQTLNELYPCSDLLKDLLRAVARDEAPHRWVQARLAGHLPTSHIDLCAAMMVQDFIERMTRPPGTRRLCYN